ncbi:MAG: acetolactate synthase 2 catalytic subunit [Deltaproteobacteria bacterium]|nr:MAG: acetolactate synthase 2 catalytic subunit [Deltaproteobacteria bacterium]
MNAAEALVMALVNEGVDTVFGYPGGAILPFYDALVDAPLRHILPRHEQGAAFAADAYARVTGNVGVCVATSGPGATNLLTGIANAMADSVPLVALTGQVPSSVLGTDAFQEVDIVGMSMPVVKHNVLVRDPNDVPRAIHEAFHIARSGRPGPVLVDLPKDVLLAECTAVAEPLAPAPVPAPCAAALDRALELLGAAERPLIYAGGGVRIAGASAELRAFVAASGIPTVCTLQALGSLPADHPLFLGMLGMHGLKAANYAVQSCDLLLVVGARFDDRVTSKLATFAPDARVVHLDVDPAEVGKRREPDVSVLGDLRASLRGLTGPSLGSDAWRVRCATWRRDHAWHYAEDGLDGPRFLRALSEAVGPEALVACDVGQHQMWVAQHWQLFDPRHHLTSGGLGAMGYGLPAAIGAQLARPDARVVCVSGDGSIQMNLQELATLSRYGLPIAVVVLDNQCLGMVRQWQELFADRRYSEIDLSDNPDFVRVADAFGLDTVRVDQLEDVPEALSRVAGTTRPLLVHVRLQREANVWPFVPPGAPNHHMMDRSAPQPAVQEKP